MPKVSFRSHADRPPPQPIELPVPGWAGEPQPRADGSHEQIWHCTPFSEGARYGLELIYPFDIELRVTCPDGKVCLDANWGSPPSASVNWPPFRPFGEFFYSYQILLDLKVEPGWAIRTEPHPRFYADARHETPLAVPALIRSEWWPMMFFMIFKAPPPGATHVFRKGEPFASVIVLPTDPALELVAMDDKTAAERELRARRIHASRDTLGKKSRWLSATETVFDGTYRHMLRAAKARGRGA